MAEKQRIPSSIAACSSRFGGEEDKGLEWCKEDEEEIQVAVHEHYYSMDLATLDKQVGHTHGQVVAVGPVGDGMGHLQHGKEVVAAVQSHKEGGSEHILALSAAQEVAAGNKVLGGEKDESCSQVLFAAEKWLSEFDGVDSQKGSCKDQCSYHPGN